MLNIRLVILVHLPVLANRLVLLIIPQSAALVVITGSLRDHIQNGKDWAGMVKKTIQKHSNFSLIRYKTQSNRAYLCPQFSPTKMLPNDYSLRLSL